MAADLTSLNQTFGDALKQCVEQGFVFPIHIAVVGANGSVIIGRYSQSEDGVSIAFLAEHLEDDGFVALPVNIMLVDARSEAARIVIHHDGQPQWMN